MVQRHHVFLSYNSDDKQAVETLAVKLREAGLNPWLDVWNVLPGDLWQEKLESGLDACESCAIFIGPNGTHPWHKVEMRAALNKQVREKGFRVIPVLLPGRVYKAEDMPLFLRQFSFVKFRDLDDAEAFLRLLTGINNKQPPQPPGGGCPYRGLRYFDVKDADLFHGRGKAVGAALDRLRSGMGTREPARFLAIVGCSGSGKSSFARAGLLASLKRDRINGSSAWPAVVCRPGSNPVESLTIALSAKLGIDKNPGQVLDLNARFIAGENVLHVTARMLLEGGPPERRLVVLVDQFEECFTICRDKGLREAFFKNLSYAANTAQGQTIVLVAMRADFYGDCAGYPYLATSVSEHQILLGPMNEGELREAIELPALEKSVQFEPGLVELLLEEVQDEQGALPLLQYTLEELWARRQGAWLTHAAYQELGKVKGVLGRRADVILSQFNPAEAHMCRHILLQLTQHIEGDKYTRRRVPLSDLVSTRFDAASLQPVLDQLAGENGRLVVMETKNRTDNAQMVEMSHEALIDGWPRFREWLNEDRDFQRWRKRLWVSLDNWREMNQDESALLRGAVLDEALKWSGVRADGLGHVERDFINACASHRAREERTARNQRRNVWIAAVAGVLLLLTGVVSMALAQRESRLAESRRLAAAARNGLLQSDPSRALPIFLALHAVELEETAEAKEALHQVVQFAGGAALAGSKSAILDIAYSPDGSQIATGEEDGTARLWDSQSKREIRPLFARSEPVYSVAFSPDGRHLATGARDTATVWDVGSGTVLTTLLRQPDEIRSVKFAGKGTALVTGGWDGSILFWNASTGARDRTLSTEQKVACIALSPDGSRLTTAHSDGSLKLWELKTGKILHEFAGQRPLKSVAVSTDGKRIAAAIWDGGVMVWDADSWKQLLSFVADADGLNGIAFSPDGAFLVTVGRSPNAKLWDSQSGREILTLLGADDALTAATFAPSKELRVAVASRDRTVRIYELDLDRLKQRARRLIEASASPLSKQDCAAYPGLKPCPPPPPKL